MSRIIIYFHVYIILEVMLKVMKIPTQKGEHSCKYTELSL